MKIVNTSRREVISGDAEIRRSFTGRLTGLMLSKKKDIVLESMREDTVSATIHMVLMRYPIDVIWLDSQKRAVDFQKDVKPFNPLKPGTWRTCKPKKPAKYVVELGRSRLGEIEVGDGFRFVG
ncbi:MAG: DUF192 domain-containing protein [Candidatus Altiarchaeota archaeon]